MNDVSQASVADLPSGFMYCRGCAKHIHCSATQCPSCGAIQGKKGGDKSKSTAIILAILLGGIGIHDFYLERNVSGVVKLLFCWTFIPFFISFFDVLILALQSRVEFDRKYN